MTENRIAIVFALSGLLVAATINGFHSSQSYFWLAANVAYTLPVVILVFYVSLVIQVASSPERRMWIGVVSTIGALICFVNAGFSAMYLVFQGTVLTGLLFGLIIFVGKNVRRPYLILFGVGFVATVASAIVQHTAPGVSLRMNSPVEARFGTPVRYLPDLLKQTISVTFEHVGHQEAFAGFMLLCAAAILITLHLNKERNPFKAGASPKFAAGPLWAGMIIQLLLVPVLWAHTSDSPQFLGRFSSAYSIVIVVNIVLTTAFAMMIFYRARICEWLRKRDSGRHICIAMILLVSVALFSLTQLRSIHFKAATYLFISALVFLLIGAYQLSAFSSDARSKRLLQLALYASAVLLIAWLALVAVSIYSLGYLSPRILAPAGFLQALLGMIWGIYVGLMVQSIGHSTEGSKSWLTAYRGMGLMLAIAIGVGIVFGQSRSLPKMKTFASEWDDRHAEIIRQRDNGNTTIVVPELSYDFGYDLVSWHIFDINGGGRCSAVYYGVDSIIRSDDGG